MTETFKFSSRARNTFLVMIALGVIGIIWTALTGQEGTHNARFFSNLLLNSYYFTGIALAGLFFVTAHQLGYSGWHTALRRIPEAFGAYLPITFVFVLVILAGLWAGWHHIFPWADEAHVTGDSIIEGKTSYLNKGFFSLRVLIYFVIWIVFSFLIRNVSKAEASAAANNLAPYKRYKKISAIFLFFFAISTSMISWDMIMSTDPHWYSTLFGWYNFASYMCAGIAFMILILVYMKSRGYLNAVNDNHLHDLGKYLFGFSVFYTYLWFSQFLLIWYANIPEATQYFGRRMDIPFFKILFFATFIINFILPLLVLMTRGAKRNYGTIAVVSILLIGGHYLDFYMMVMPQPALITEHRESGHDHEEGHETDAHGDEHSMDLSSEEMHVILAQHNDDEHATEEHATDEHHEDEHATEADAHAHDDEVHAATDAGHGHDDHGGHELLEGEIVDAAHNATNYRVMRHGTIAGLGLKELLMFIGFAGGFLFVVFSTLSKGNLVPEKSPFLKESIKHHI